MVLGIIFISAGDIMAVDAEQVLTYNDKNFGGLKQEYNGAFSRDVMDGGYNDTYSSLIVGKGVKVTLYNDAYQKGSFIVLYPGEYKDLDMEMEGNPWNDKTSSLKIEKLSDPNLPLIKLTFGRNGKGFTQMIGLDGVDEYKWENGLLLNDDVISAEIPAEYKVTFYEDKEYGGDHNSEPISGKRVNMSELGLQGRVSSIKIEWNKYKLQKIVMKETARTTLNSVESQVTNGDGKIDNPSAATDSITKTKETKYSTTATTSWENTSSIGITATTTVTGTAGVEGVASSSVEASLAVSIAEQFAFGKEETKTHETTLSDSITVQAPPYSSIGLYFEITPAVVDYDLTYTYVSVDNDGNPDGKGKDRVIKGKMKVTSASSVDLKTRDINPSSSPAPSTQPEAEKGYAAQAWEWIKQRPCRLYEFFGGTNPAMMCGGANDTANSIPNSNTNTSVQPSNSSTNAK